MFEMISIKMIEIFMEKQFSTRGDIPFWGHKLIIQERERRDNECMNIEKKKY